MMSERELLDEPEHINPDIIDQSRDYDEEPENYVYVPPILP